MLLDRVRHRSTPAEPWGKPGECGTIARTAEDNLRITPAGNGIPAQAYVQWDADPSYQTWERLADLTRLGGRRK